MENSGFLKLENQNELNKILDEVDCITFRFIESWCKSHGNVCNLTINQMVALRPTKSTYFTIKRSIDFLLKNNLVYKNEVAYRTYVYTVANDEQIALFIHNSIDANCINADCINANCYNTLMQNAKTPYSKMLKPLIANCYNIKEYNKEYSKDINLKNGDVQTSCTPHQNDNQNSNQLTVIQQERPKQSKFIKPSTEEVISYMEERGAFNPRTEGEHFYDYYTSNGWKVGRNSMKDWKAAVRNWLKPKYSNHNSIKNKGVSTEEEKNSQAKRIIQDLKNSGFFINISE